MVPPYATELVSLDYDLYHYVEISFSGVIITYIKTSKCSFVDILNRSNNGFIPKFKKRLAIVGISSCF